MTIAGGSMLEVLMWQQLPTPLRDSCEREFRFANPRRWRFDFAWPQQLIAVEIEGGSWVNGAHSRGKHFESDCEKYAEAAVRGWRVLRFTSLMVQDGRALEFVHRALR